MTSIICPKCGTENSAGATNCRKCRINLHDAQEHPALFEGPEQQATQGEQAAPEEPQKTYNLGCANVMRWIGRVWGLLLIVFLSLILFFWYLGSAGGAGPPGYVYLVGITIVVGMIVAWWREGLGALVSLAGLVGFYAALSIYDRDSFRTWAGISSVFILPPIALLLASSLLRRHMAANSLAGRDRID